MDDARARAIAEGYVAYVATGEPAVLEMFAQDFYDNVSKTRGLDIFDTVSQWFEESFADRSASLHQVARAEDTVLVWFTFRGRHVGNGFPRLRGLPIAGKEVSWPQVHVFRFEDDMVVEHWAVRDDAAMLDDIAS